MFYVFYFNEGACYPLDENAAMGTVHGLQLAIEKTVGIVIAQQVLLISGGTELKSELNISSYGSIGTESNPVFLFNKVISGTSVLSKYVSYIDNYVKETNACMLRLESLEKQHISSNLVQTYRLIHQKIWDVFHSVLQRNNTIYREHQMLHQGLRTIVANFDDSYKSVNKRLERLSQSNRVHNLHIRAANMVDEFHSVIPVLHQLKIPHSLWVCSCFARDSGKTGEISLYEYISLMDKDNKVELIAKDFLELLDKIDTDDLIEANELMESLSKEVKPEATKGIVGFTSVHLNEMSERISILTGDGESVQRRCCSFASLKSGDNQLSNDAVKNYRAHYTEIKRVLHCAMQESDWFANSKSQAISSTMSFFDKYLKLFGRLHKVNTILVVHEEKYAAMRKRLGVMRQIITAPVIYASAITECIRRNTLLPEFVTWFGFFTEKSKNFVRQESIIRETFEAKLQKHFLRHIFPNIFDQFPDFTLGNFKPFDKNVPRIDYSYLRSLREALPHLTAILKVPEPTVYQKLAVCDPNVQVTTSSGLTRTESFFTSDVIPYFGLGMTRQFSSSNWISCDESIDTSSPITNPFLAKLTQSIVSKGESNGLQCGNSTKTNLETNDTTSKYVNTFTADEENNRATFSEETHSDLNASQKASVEPKSIDSSSKTQETIVGTPTHHQFVQTDVMDMGKPVIDRETMCQVRTDCVILSVDLANLKASFSTLMNRSQEEIDSVLHHVSTLAKMFMDIEEKRSDSDHDDAYVNLSEIVLDLKVIRDTVEMSVAEEKTTLVSQNETITELEERNGSLTEELERMIVQQDKRRETLIIEKRLELEHAASFHNDQIEIKDNAISSLNEASEKARESYDQLLQQSAIIYTARECSEALEANYKLKMLLLMKDVEGKKSEEIARIKMEAELEIKELSRKYERVLQGLRECPSNQCILIESIGNDTTQHTDTVEATGSRVCTPDNTSAYCALDPRRKLFRGSSSSRTVDGNIVVEDEGKHELQQTSECSMTGSNTECFVSDNGTEGDFLVSKKSVCSETDLTLKDMSRMITIENIREGSVVFLVWSNPHKAYKLFSLSPVLCFVKASSLRRMGVALDDAALRPECFIAVVSSMEYCQIRKGINRYKLAIGERFHRVDVKPLCSTIDRFKQII